MIIGNKCTIRVYKRKRGWNKCMKILLTCIRIELKSWLSRMNRKSILSLNYWVTMRMIN